jgi:hypothetical protein
VFFFFFASIYASNPFIMPFNINASVANFLPSFFSREKSAIYVVVVFSALGYSM